MDAELDGEGMMYGTGWDAGIWTSDRLLPWLRMVGDWRRDGGNAAVKSKREVMIQC